MINISTLSAIFIMMGVYIFITFWMIAKMRKVLKIYFYIIVFIGLIFPDFKEIFSVKLNVQTYAILLAGIELFEMMFKFVVEEQIAKKRILSRRIKMVYEGMK